MFGKLVGVLPAAGLRRADSGERGRERKRWGAEVRSPPAKRTPWRPQRLSVRQASRLLGLNPSEDAQNLRESAFPCISKEIQNYWHSFRSHKHSCNNMAKQWGVNGGRYFNVWAWPARRAGQVRRLKILPPSTHHCLAILLQLCLRFLDVCQ